MIIAHLTSVHDRYDSRIFHKMCRSLAVKDLSVFLVVADGKGDEEKNGVSILDVGATSGGRFSRMTKTVNRVFEKAKELKVDMYHLHDPELIPIGLKLKKLGKKVIFDAHEDVGASILDKYYLNYFFRNMFFRIYKLYEKNSLKKFDGLIAATPYIKKQFLKINTNSEDICNYPIINELKNNDLKKISNNFQICYVGGIEKDRGILELVRSLKLTKNLVKLNLAGNFTEKKFEEDLKKEPGWKHVNYLGYLDRDQVKKVYKNSIIGVVTMHDTNNHVNSLPIKMFEYMISKLPIIASNFVLFIDILSRVKCGINVNPKNPSEIANAIDAIIDNPEKRTIFGENGYQAVIREFNWNIEEKKLISFYYKTINSI